MEVGSSLNNIIVANNPGSLILEQTEYNDDTRLIEGIYNNHVGIYHACLYKTKDIDELFPCGPGSVLHQDVLYLLLRYGHRNSYINTISISTIDSENEPFVSGLDWREFKRSIERIHSGIHDEKYRPWKSKYLETITALETNLEYASYIRSSKFNKDEFYALFPSECDIKYTETRVDRQLVDALKNPELNIDFLKSRLTLDEATGYYVGKDGIPYMCVHEFMMYDGASIKRVIEACANSSYVCKFCGTGLTFDLESETIDFTPIQYRVIYLFIELLNMITYETFIAQIVMSSISKSIAKIDFDNMDPVLAGEAFTATYVYKLYKHLTGQLNLKFNMKDGIFIAFVRHIWTKAGWDDEIVDNLISNDERFIGYTHCVDIIVAFKEDSTRHLDEDNIIRLLLENVDSAANPIQKLYLKDKTALGKMVDLLTKSGNNYIEQVQLPMIVDASKKVTCATNVIELFLIAGSDLKSFYDVWGTSVCPVNGVHEWEKNACIHCGMKEDGSNIEAILKKYDKKIDSLVVRQEAADVKQKGKSRSNLINDIKAASKKQPAGVPPILFTDAFVEKVRSRLEELLHIGVIDELPRSNEVNCQIINYLFNTGMSTETVMIELDMLTVSPSKDLSTMMSVLQ